MEKEQYEKHMMEDVIVCGIHDIIDTMPSDLAQEKKEQYIDTIVSIHREHGCPDGTIFIAKRKEIIASHESVGLP